jgi:hypothetical protein
VLPFDIEGGTAGEPESLGAADLGDRGVVPFCAEGDAGWILDTAWSAAAHVAVRDGKTGSLATAGSLHNLYARERLSADHACIERLSGTYEAEAAAPAAFTGNTKPEASTAVRRDRSTDVLVSAFRSGTRSPLRCQEK